MCSLPLFPRPPSLIFLLIKDVHIGNALLEGPGGQGPHAPVGQKVHIRAGTQAHTSPCFEYPLLLTCSSPPAPEFLLGTSQSPEVRIRM